jgi:hypothetical protein
MANYNVTTAGAAFQFDTQDCLWNSVSKIDDTHFINFWAGVDSDGFVQVFTVNTSTWAVTTAGAVLEYDTANGTLASSHQIDANHFINFWYGAANYGLAQVFTVDTTTWAVTTANARLSFDTQYGLYNNCYKIDDNHFINFWRGGGSLNGFVQVFTVNTSTWAVTTANAILEYDATDAFNSDCFQIDSNHFINFFAGSDEDGFAQVFTVNTSTWAVTTAGSALEFDTVYGRYNNCYKIDDNHFINFWSGADGDGFVQTFTVNTSTWVVTTANARLEFDTVNTICNSCYKIDTNHFINFWGGNGNDGFVQVFTVNTSTWAVTTTTARLEFDTQTGLYNGCCEISTGYFINFFQGGAGADGYAQVFSVELPSIITFIPQITFI